MEAETVLGESCILLLTRIQENKGGQPIKTIGSFDPLWVDIILIISTDQHHLP